MTDCAPHPHRRRPRLSFRTIYWLGLVALAAAVLAESPAAAQFLPRGDEIQINGLTTGAQVRPSIAANPTGGFVVVWESDVSGGSDTSDSSIQAQIYTDAGAPLGAQFQVNAHTPYGQWRPSVATDGDGNFVVAWSSAYSEDDGDGILSIQARRFSSEGTALGGQFRVNTYTESYQFSPVVASTADGAFVVAWESYGSSGSDNDSWSIQARRFGADGLPLGDDFQVNSYTTSYQQHAALTVGSSGEFVVAWRSYGSYGTDTSFMSVQARRFAADGTPAGNQFQVNSLTTGYQHQPAIANAPAGGFVIVWQSWVSGGDDTSQSSIQGQRFQSNGTPLEGQFQVNSYTTEVQTEPSIGADLQGNFVVSWSDALDLETFTLWSIQARRFSPTGVPLGEQLEIDTLPAPVQWRPRVAVDPEGDFVVAWETWGPAGTDTSDESIRGSRWKVPFFVDGLESGSWDRWSSATP